MILRFTASETLDGHESTAAPLAGTMAEIHARAAASVVSPPAGLSPTVWPAARPQTVARTARSATARTAHLATAARSMHADAEPAARLY
jgi:hypothetical protein